MTFTLFSFSMKFNISYNLKQFFFKTDGEVFKFKLNASFFRVPKTIHFLTHRTNTMQFSKILKMRKFTPTNDSIDSSAGPPIDFHYCVGQELFLIRHIDKFHFIKNLFRNPLSLFGSQVDDVHDVNGYLARLLNDFRETYEKVTLNLPIRKDLFHLEIDQPAFESYFNETYEHDQRRPVSSIYEREFAINYYRRENKSLNAVGSDFSFSLIHFKKVGFVWSICY